MLADYSTKPRGGGSCNRVPIAPEGQGIYFDIFGIAMVLPPDSLVRALASARKGIVLPHQGV